ncbi:MAG: thioredoxin family protein [Candidatus Desantisbacteria bacterium]
MLRLCICLMVMCLIGCQCPDLKEKHVAKEVTLMVKKPINMAKEAALLAENSINTATKTVAEAVQEKPMEVTNIQWVTAFDDGLKMAKEKNCPLMVDFFAQWCGWCVKLDEETWTNKDVIQLAQRFVCVKVDVDTDRQTPARYGARSLPTILFINPDGKVIHQVIGYRNSEDMLGEMKKVQS